MVNRIVNEGKMDQALKALGSSFTTEEKWKINGAAVEVFNKGLRLNIMPRQGVQYRDPNYVPRRQAMLDTLIINKDKGGEVSTGFSKRGKKAYLARFMNDGWDVRNKQGGPYTHVAGEHFWEKTESDFGESVKAAEARALKEVMHERGLP